MYSFVAEFLALIILIIIVTNINFRSRMNATNRITFCHGIVFNILSIVVDGVCLWTLAHAQTLPLSVNYFLNTLYYLICFFMISAYTMYVFNCMLHEHDEQVILRTVRRIVYVMNTISCVVALANPFNGYLFYFDSAGNYCHGPLWVIGYIQLGVDMLIMAICFFYYRRKMDNVIAHMLRTGIPVMILLAAFQLLYPSILLNGMMGATIALILLIILQSNDIESDTLTELGNWRSFNFEIKSMQSHGRPYQVIMTTLYDFGDFNSTYGFECGNRVMFAIGKRLRTEYPLYNSFRIRSTSFATVIPYTDDTTARRNFGSLSKMLPQKWMIDGQEYPVSMSFVNYVCRDGSEGPTVVLERLEYARKLLKVRELEYVVVDRKMIEGIERKQQLTQYLKKAVVEKRFQVWLQPVYCVETGDFRSAEALLRLKDEKGKFISPSEFVPIAEESNLISDIGKRVIESVCAFLGTNRSLPINMITVNLAMRQLKDRMTIKNMTSAVKLWETPMDKIAFEITERMLLSRDSTVISTLQYLRDQGYPFLLDDFGTGYSNFSSVLDFPFSHIKIDKSILYAEEAEDYLTIRALVEIFHKNGKMVIVEGVETEEQAKSMIELGADYLQGFYYAKPMPMNEFINFINDKNAH